MTIGLNGLCIACSTALANVRSFQAFSEVLFLFFLVPVPRPVDQIQNILMFVYVCPKGDFR